MLGAAEMPSSGFTPAVPDCMPPMSPRMSRRFSSRRWRNSFSSARVSGDFTFFFRRFLADFFDFVEVLPPLAPRAVLRSFADFFRDALRFPGAEPEDAFFVDFFREALRFLLELDLEDDFFVDFFRGVLALRVVFLLDFFATEAVLYTAAGGPGAPGSAACHGTKPKTIGFSRRGVKRGRFPRGRTEDTVSATFALRLWAFPPLGFPAAGGRAILPPMDRRRPRRPSSSRPAFRPVRTACVLAAAAVAVFALHGLYALLLGDNFHAVVPGEVYRSAQPSPAQLRRWTARYGLRSVVNLRGESSCEFHDAEHAIASKLGLEMVDVRLSAVHQPPAPELRRLIQALETAPM